MAKAKAGRVGSDVTLSCVELCASVGYSEAELLEKWARDSKILDIFEGTQQIQQLIVARVLGSPAPSSEPPRSSSCGLVTNRRFGADLRLVTNREAQALSPARASTSSGPSRSGVDRNTVDDTPRGEGGVPVAVLGDGAGVGAGGVGSGGGPAAVALDPGPDVVAVAADDRQVEHGDGDLGGVAADLGAVAAQHGDLVVEHVEVARRAGCRRRRARAAIRRVRRSPEPPTTTGIGAGGRGYDVVSGSPERGSALVPGAHSARIVTIAASSASSRSRGGGKASP